MKFRSVYIILIVSVLSFKVKAQTSSTHFGIKAGANYSKFMANADREYAYNFYDFDHKLGFYFGGFVNMRISDKFRFQPELLFALRGTKLTKVDYLEISSDPNNMFGNVSLNIIESSLLIPAGIQYSVSNDLYLEAGPQLLVVLNGYQEITEKPLDSINDSDLIIPSYSYGSIGVFLGFGYELFENFGINARYILERTDEIGISASVMNLGMEYRL